MEHVLRITGDEWRRLKKVWRWWNMAYSSRRFLP